MGAEQCSEKRNTGLGIPRAFLQGVSAESMAVDRMLLFGLMMVGMYPVAKHSFVIHQQNRLHTCMLHVKSAGLSLQCHGNILKPRPDYIWTVENVQVLMELQAQQQYKKAAQPSAQLSALFGMTKGAQKPAAFSFEFS